MLGPPSPAHLAMQRADFEAQYYLNLVTSKGYPAVWEKAIICPNRIDDRTKHRVDCKVCDGRGFLYSGATKIRVALMSLTLKEMWREIGRFDLGTAMLTTTPDNRIGYWDKLTLTESRMSFTEVIQRNPKSALPDKLRYEPLTMERVIDVAGATYTENVDFTISGKSLTWITGKGPQLPRTGGAPVFYSVAYFHRPIYIVLDLIHAFRDTPVLKEGNAMHEMPVQAVARLDFLMGDPSREEGT